MSKQLFKSKNFWVITIYIIFLLIDHFALDSNSGKVWDKLKLRSLKLKNMFKLN